MPNDAAPDQHHVAEPSSGDARPEEAARVTRVNWDDSNMQTSFANVLNVLNTREEFTLLFGTNQSWNITDLRELTVKLSNRIVLTPFAAKRLFTLLDARVQEYEKRFGVLSLDG